MNLEKFTDRAKGFLQAAQTVAIRMSHQRITPEHILKALLEDKEGMAAGLVQRAGGNAGYAVQEVDRALAKVPAGRDCSWCGGQGSARCGGFPRRGQSRDRACPRALPA